MRARVEWLSVPERSSIIDEALGVLEKTGLRLGVCQALKSSRQQEHRSIGKRGLRVYRAILW